MHRLKGEDQRRWVHFQTQPAAQPKSRLRNNCCASSVVVQLLEGQMLWCFVLIDYVKMESDGGQLIAACGSCQNVFCSLYQVPLVIS